MSKRRALISYSHRDEAHRSALEVALSAAVRAGEIEIWSDHRILPGQDLDETILSQLQSADLVLLLVSPDFIASDYCYRKELQIALERHENKRAVVVPIVVRPTDWQGTQFSKLLMLPYEAKPVSVWQNTDEAWLDVARGIRRLLGELPAEQSEHKVFSSKELRSRLKDSFEELQVRFENPGARSGASFGIPTLDELSDGISSGELTIIVSRPDQGHIELALALITNQTLGEGKNRKSVVFSQRSSASNFTNRLLCSLGLVSRSRFARGALEDDDWSRVTGGIRMLKDADITIDDDPIRSVLSLRAKLDEIREMAFGLILIEGVEYLNSGGQERDIALALKDFAKQEGVAVVATLTLGPEVDLRVNRRPMLSDLASWYELGEAAGKVILCSRELDRTWFGVSDGLVLGADVQVMLAKSSDGLQGAVTLRFHEESGAIYELPSEAVAENGVDQI